MPKTVEDILKRRWFISKSYDNRIGQYLRKTYENAGIKNESDFKEELKNVLSGGKKI